MAAKTLSELVALMPPLPAKVPPRDRPQSYMDHLDTVMLDLYNGDTDKSAEFRSYVSTIDTVDSVTGKRSFDNAFAARGVKDHAGVLGMYPDIAESKEAKIASKMQWVMRRWDSPEQLFSRNARIKQLTDQSQGEVVDIDLSPEGEQVEPTPEPEIDDHAEPTPENLPE